ncbi:MAG: hypothetical protein ABJE95_38440 [Byssovorax sp.]
MPELLLATLLDAVVPGAPPPDPPALEDPSVGAPPAPAETPLLPTPVDVDLPLPEDVFALDEATALDDAAVPAEVAPPTPEEEALAAEDDAPPPPTLAEEVALDDDAIAVDDEAPPMPDEDVLTVEETPPAPPIEEEDGLAPPTGPSRGTSASQLVAAMATPKTRPRSWNRPSSRNDRVMRAPPGGLSLAGGAGDLRCCARKASASTLDPRSVDRSATRR